MHIVRLCGVNDFLAEADALAEDEGADETRDAGVDVHHRAAREVQCAHLPDVAGGGIRGINHVSATCRHPDRPRTTPCARQGSS